MQSQGGPARWRTFVGVGVTFAIVGCTTRSLPPALTQPLQVSMLGASPMTAGVDTTECRQQSLSFSSTLKREGFYRDCRRRYRIIRAISPEVLRLASLQMAIPEYHDEQRFAASADQFGPLVMAFASPTLGGFTEPGQYQEHGARGVLAAVVYVDTVVPDAALPPSYSRLGLRPGMNCLWVSLVDGRDGWDARMTRVRDEKEGCDMSGEPVELAVVRTPHTATNADLSDVPTSARFTHERDGRPLIGIKCLVGWCDVGPQAPNGSPQFVPASYAALVPELMAMRASAVSGWYDEQVLARHDAVTGGVLPGTLRASLLPTSVQYRHPLTFKRNAAKPGGEQVAVLWLHDDPAGTEYAGPQWNLTRGRNDIWLVESGGTWSMAVYNASGVHTFGSVLRHPHADAAVIPTARFRWASTDDAIWVGCGQACCRADGDS